MLGADPPRRPPHRNPLTRSKSCHGPTRRKRGREVLEDITWIVNHPSSWQNDTSAGPSTFNNNDREDGTLGAHLEELAVVPQRLVSLLSHFKEWQQEKSLMLTVHHIASCWSIECSISSCCCFRFHYSSSGKHGQSTIGYFSCSNQYK